MLILTLYYPILLSLFGHPDWGPILSGYLGIFLVGAVFLSIGIFASSLTSNQIVAYAVGSVFVEISPQKIWAICLGSSGEEFCSHLLSSFYYLLITHCIYPPF